MNPKVSIIVPVYNVEAYLEQCIQSLIHQTYENCEFIFVNDGSPDHSDVILERYAQMDSRIQIIRQENQGLSGARNRGLEAATGEYVVFQDSDDWLDVEAIHAAVHYSGKHDLDIVLWSYISEYHDRSMMRRLFGEEPVVWEDAKQIHRRIVGLSGSELSEPHKADACVTAWGKLYRRDVIGNCRFVDTKRIGTEDALFNTYVFGNASRVGYLPNAYCHYRKTNETSLTSGYKSRLVLCWGELYRLMEEYLADHACGADFYQALSNRVCLSMIGIGLNELRNPDGFFKKAANLRATLGQPRWEKAFKALDFRYFPLKWKVFFLLCKYKQTALLLAMLYAINGLRAKMAK